LKSKLTVYKFRSSNPPSKESSENCS